MKASVKRVMNKFLTSLLFVIPKANMLLFRSGLKKMELAHYETFFAVNKENPAILSHFEDWVLKLFNSLSFCFAGKGFKFVLCV